MANFICESEIKKFEYQSAWLLLLDYSPSGYLN